MEYRLLRKPKREVSSLGLGMWSLVTDEWGANTTVAEEVVRKAYEDGVTLFDTADIYGSGKGEEILGKVLGTKRGDCIILTKIGYDLKAKGRQNFSLDYLNQAVKDSMKRLSTDFIDILMLHNPRMNVIKDVNILEFLLGLERDGLVGNVGVSMGPTLGWGDEAVTAVTMGYESLEHIYNAIERDPGRSLLKYEVDHFIRVPHASDVLDEERWPLTVDPKLHRKFKDPAWLKEALKGAQILKEGAEKRGLKLYEASLLFVLSDPHVSSVIPNISNLTDLERFVRTIGKDMDPELMSLFDHVYKIHFLGLNKESIEETSRYK